MAEGGLFLLRMCARMLQSLRESLSEGKEKAREVMERNLLSKVRQKGAWVADSVELSVQLLISAQSWSQGKSPM